MKLIVFALAAIAFSGSSSSKSNNKDSQPTSPASQPTVKPPQPQPGVQLSEEEKANPLGAFDTMKKTVDWNKRKLTPLKQDVEKSEMALDNIKKIAEKAKKERKDTYNRYALLQSLEDKNEKLTREMEKLKNDLVGLTEEEEKKYEAVKKFETRLTQAKSTFNEAWDQLVASELELRSKGPLLVQRANEIAKEEEQKVEKAKQDLAESEEALEKSKKIVQGHINHPGVTSEKLKKEAVQRVVEDERIHRRNQDAARDAQEKAKKASKGAKDLEKERSAYAELYKSFFNSNQFKKY